MLPNVNWGWINEYSWALFALVMIGLIIVVKGFFGEAGKDLYALVKRKLWPLEPEPVRVRSNFQPKNLPGNLFLWINEDNVTQRLAEGFSYYCDREDGAKRFYLADPETLPAERTFYMWRPGQNETNDAD